MPTKVLYLNHGAKPSGAEFALLRLLGALDRSMVSPVIVFGDNGPAVEAMREINVETHVLPLSSAVREVRKDTLGPHALLRLAKGSAVFAYALRIAKFARQRQIQIIHTNTIKAHVYGALAARLAGLPVVWHLRDFVNDSYFPPMAVRAIRFLARHAPTHVVAVSRSVLEQLHLEDGGRRSTVVWDGLSEAELCQGIDGNKPASPGARPRVGIIGRVARWKGQHIFVEAAAKVLKRGVDAEFLIVGSPLFGEESYEADLHEQVGQLGIGGNVRFLGFVREIPALMRSLDVVVHASISGEPFGQVITEGMAAGKPVIATRGGGVPEIITHGETGLLVPMGDSDALAAALFSLLENPKKAARLGRAGYDHVRKAFTAARGARQVEKIYRAIAERG